MKGNETPYQKIRELEKKLKRLEQEKEILNRAIADEQMGTDMRKKYLALLSEASRPDLSGHRRHGVRVICRVLGSRRQHSYKQRQDQHAQEQVREQIRLMVCRQGKLLPKVGGEKAPPSVAGGTGGARHQMWQGQALGHVGSVYSVGQAPETLRPDDLLKALDAEISEPCERMQAEWSRAALGK